MRGFESASFHGSEWEWFGEGRSVGVFVLSFFVCLLGLFFLLNLGILFCFS